MFRKDLERGKEAEKYAAARLIEYGYSCGEASGLCHDFTVNGHKAEVKFDIYSARSGNIAFEIGNPRTNKQTGVLASSAEYIIYVLPKSYKDQLPDQIWVADTAELKRFINTNLPKKTILAGGDGNATLVLYDKEAVLGPVFSSGMPNSCFS